MGDTKILILCSLSCPLCFSSSDHQLPSDDSLYLCLFSFLSFFPCVSFFSPAILSLCRADGSGWVVIQSQAGCSNHRLLIGFIILTQDLRWERISWPRSAALKAAILMHTLMHPHTHMWIHTHLPVKTHTHWLSSFLSASISHFLTAHHCFDSLYKSTVWMCVHACVCVCGIPVIKQ